ncbi:hypothetical protein [Caulobacter sp. UNC358MFTsu5.1]|uniref:hypothetical protein n=1 Tax=Caulobacter sp. UNC358MFTsu5.1 TaxID=1449049 RepID=UPI0004A728D1|nr:hypothetical protein [Caulobacter sp. UNC358MFTsu5.1]
MRNRRFPPLPTALAKQLSTIKATDGGLYRPCVATLRDGTVLNCVYFAEAQRWFRYWGVWPDEDRGKTALDIETVASVADSPSRLPAPFADALYEAGESGMGYTVFTVQFEDGTSVAVGTGNAVDFIVYPPGQSRDTVVKVLPHVGRGDPKITAAPPYSWCLYDAG